MRWIIGIDDIVFGYFGILGYVFFGWIGSLCGKGFCFMEEMNLLKNFSFLCDSFILILLIMMIIYLIMVVSVGCEYVEVMFMVGKIILVYVIIMVIIFVVGVFIIL